jgi:hypothetical protein
LAAASRSTALARRRRGANGPSNQNPGTGDRRSEQKRYTPPPPARELLRVEQGGDDGAYAGTKEDPGDGPPRSPDGGDRSLVRRRMLGQKDQ